MSIPKLLSVPFAKEGRKNIIPNERTPEMAAQLSSYASGFPAITMQKKEDGGLPPDGMDFNGILYELSDHVVYLNKGGFYKRDESFMGKIGGYPKGVILQDEDMNLYVSLADKNTDKFTDKSKWSTIGLVDIKSLLDNKVSSELLAASLELKQDTLTFTGTGDVVRKSVTDTLDRRVATAQSSADSALQTAQSKQDKLEFVGTGNVVRKSVTDALDKRVTTAQSKADDAYSLAESRTTEAWVKSVSLGIDQTYRDVTSQRFLNVDYKNATERPIVVFITNTTASAPPHLTLDIMIDNVLIGKISSNDQFGQHKTATVVLKAGSTIRVVRKEGVLDIEKWVELS